MNHYQSPARKILYSTINRNESAQCADSNTTEDDGAALNQKKVAEKIKTLSSDISIQQHHIEQAINALNTCAASFEFSGSTESVVAEWKLLVTSK